MKKTLLSIGAALLLSVGAMAQTVTLPYNQYGTGIEFQGMETTKLASYTPKLNDIINIHIVGTASEDMSDLLVAVVDDSQTVDYWGQFSNMLSFGAPIAKGVAFDRTVELTITSLTQTDQSKPSFGTALSNPKLVFVGKNAVLGSAGSIVLNLTTFTVNPVSILPGATVFTESGGKKQSPAIVDKISNVQIGNSYKITITGTTDVDASEFQVVLVDGTAAANYWTELSDYIGFEPTDAAAAGVPFTLTAELTVNALPVGAGSDALQLYVTAASTADRIQVSNFTVTVQNTTGISTVASSSVKVYAVDGGLTIEGADKAATIYGVDGTLVATTTGGTIALPKGVYIVKVGNEAVKAIVK